MTLPVPLAQLQQRAWNAKTPLERHQAAYHLWEASLRLLGSVAVARYAELKKRRRDLTDLLTRLACPTLEHWCKLIGETVPELAEATAAPESALNGRSGTRQPAGVCSISRRRPGTGRSEKDGRELKLSVSSETDALISKN